MINAFEIGRGFYGGFFKIIPYGYYIINGVDIRIHPIRIVIARSRKTAFTFVGIIDRDLDFEFSKI